MTETWHHATPVQIICVVRAFDKLSARASGSSNRRLFQRRMEWKTKLTCRVTRRCSP